MPTKKTLNDFKNQFIHKYGHEFDLSRVVYVNAKTNVKIICKTHGEFLSTPDNFLTKRNKNTPCPKCSLILSRNAKSLTTKLFILKAQNLVSKTSLY